MAAQIREGGASIAPRVLQNSNHRMRTQAHPRPRSLPPMLSEAPKFSKHTTHPPASSSRDVRRGPSHRSRATKVVGIGGGWRSGAPGCCCMQLHAALLAVGLPHGALPRIAMRLVGCWSFSRRRSSSAAATAALSHGGAPCTRASSSSRILRMDLESGWGAVRQSERASGAGSSRVRLQILTADLRSECFAADLLPRHVKISIPLPTANTEHHAPCTELYDGRR